MPTIADRLIDARIKAGFNKAAPAARAIGVNYQTYIGHEDGSRIPKAEFVEKYAKAFGISSTWLLTGAAGNETKNLPLKQIRVEGVSQAGMFRDISIIEDNEHEREEIPIPYSNEYSHAHQYGLLVAGDSMNKRFSECSYVHCASWGDLGLELKAGMVLHVERIKAASMVETTIKVYAERDGKRWLDPDSTNTTHKPIEINGGLDTEIMIKGAVIGSYIKYKL